MKVRLLTALGLVALAACRSTPAPEEADALGEPQPQDTAKARSTDSFEFVPEGNRELSKGALKDALSFELEEFARSGFRRAMADDAAFVAELHYRSQGFAFAEVDFRVETEGAKPRLVLLIDEGPRVTIDEDALTVEGVTVFSKEEARAFFEGTRTGLLGRGDVLYVEDRVQSVPSRMTEEYLVRGYLDVVVQPVAVGFNAERTRARLTLRVKEGPRYTVRAVTLAEPTEETSLGADVLRSVNDTIAEFAGSETRPTRFQPRLPFDLRGALREVLFAAGYAEADVEVQARFDRAEARVDLAVTLRPGPLIEVGEIRVTGREKTRSSFVASRILLEEGERWTVDKERASLNRLYATGLFRRVGLELDPAQQGEERRDLLVELEELPSREFWVEPGYGSYEEARLRVGARERNLFGTGQQLSIEGTAAVKAQRARIGLSDPWFLHTELLGDLRLFFQERENPSFTERETGLGAFVTHAWSAANSTTFGYQFRSSEITDFQEITGEVAEALEDVDLSSLRLSQRYDTRMPFFLPSSGLFAEAALEWGDDKLGSELDFLRTTVTVSTYLPLRESTVLASSLRLGAIEPLGKDDVIPVQERFFGGGENSVRSYREDQLGPEDVDGDPVGGEATKTLSLELRQRLPRPEFEIAAFYDVGNVVSDASDWASGDDLGHAVGLGLRYLLPVGPLRLDVAWNPSADEDESEIVAHFALGIAF